MPMSRRGISQVVIISNQKSLGWNLKTVPETNPILSHLKSAFCALKYARPSIPALNRPHNPLDGGNDDIIVPDPGLFASFSSISTKRHEPCLPLPRALWRKRIIVLCFHPRHDCANGNFNLQSKKPPLDRPGGAAGVATLLE